MTADDPEWAAAGWLAAREAQLAAFLDRPEVRERYDRAAAALGAAAAPGTVGAPVVRGPWVFTADRPPGGAHHVVVRRDLRNPAAARTVLDPVVREPGPEPVAVDWFAPSADGRLLAAGLSRSGSERSVGSVVDLRTGERLPDRLYGVRHAAVAWLPDATGFFYTHYPDDREYGREIRLHRLGTPQRADPLYWPAGADALDWPDVELSPDGRTLLVHVSVGWSRTDVHLVDVPAGTRTTLVAGHDALTRLHFTESGALAGATGVGAPYGRVVRIDPARPAPERWTELVAESDLVIDDVSASDTSLFVVGERAMSSEVGYVDPRSGAPMRFAPLDGIGHVSLLFPTPGQSTMRNRVVRHAGPQTAVFAWSTPARPPRLVAWDAARGTVRDLAGDPGPGRPLTVRRASAAAGDGRDIPMLVVEPAGTPEHAPLPTLAHAYGGFGLSSTAAYTEVGRAWADLGNRYVIAGLRGGRERGDAWYRAGTRSARQRVFDDLYDVAGSLIASGACTPGTLAFWGSSNGGLLAAAAVVQRPGLWAAVHAAVPMTDMLSYHRFSIARLWMPDFGDPDDPDDRPWIAAYSPLHNVPERARFPAVLITTGRHDTRVHPGHAFAFTAALRAAAEDVPDRPILLSVDAEGGHGVGKPRDRYVHERAIAFALFGRAMETGPTRARSEERRTWT